MNGIAGVRLDKWGAGAILVDGQLVKYIYPENAFFYGEPEKTATLDGKRFVDIAQIIYERPFFASWKPGQVYFEYTFWNARVESSINSFDELLNRFKKLNNDGRFLNLENRTLSNGEWMYISNQDSEGYFRYYKNGYVVCVKSSYTDDISTRKRQKYSNYLKVAAENLVY